MKKNLVLTKKEEKIILELRKQNTTPVPFRKGILKHDLYSATYDLCMSDEIYSSVTLKEKQKILSDLDKDIKITCHIGTEFVSYKDDGNGKEYWWISSDSDNEKYSALSENWAKEHLKNIKVIKK